MSIAFEQWGIAFGALRANWFRAILTALGVVIGVASLVAVSAVSTGAQAGVAESIRLLGANVVVADGEFINIGTRQTATDRVMTPQDATAIAKLPAITGVAPHQDLEGTVVSAGRYKTSTYVVGMTPMYATLHNRGVSRGRAISASDISFGRSVMVIGPKPRKRLFPGLDPIGRTVRIGSNEFEVVGVLDSRGKVGQDLDNQLFIPLPIATRVLLGGINTRSIDFRVRSESLVNDTMDAVGSLLREQHHLPASYPDDFSIEDQASVLKTSQSASSTFRLLTFALAASRSWSAGSDHEHDARLGARADPRDRHPQVGRRRSAARADPVPDRGGRAQHVRRGGGDPGGDRRDTDDRLARRLADARSTRSNLRSRSASLSPLASSSVITPRAARPGSTRSQHFATSSPTAATIRALRRGHVILVGLFLALAAAAPAAARGTVEVVVTLKQPSLARAATHDRALASVTMSRGRVELRSPSSITYLAQLRRGQDAVAARIARTIPGAHVHWRYGITLNGLAVVVPAARCARSRTSGGSRRSGRPRRTTRRSTARPP